MLHAILYKPCSCNRDARRLCVWRMAAAHSARTHTFWGILSCVRSWRVYVGVETACGAEARAALRPHGARRLFGVDLRRRILKRRRQSARVCGISLSLPQPAPAPAKILSPPEMFEYASAVRARVFGLTLCKYARMRSGWLGDSKMSRTRPGGPRRTRIQLLFVRACEPHHRETRAGRVRFRTEKTKGCAAAAAACAINAQLK